MYKVNMKGVSDIKRRGARETKPHNRELGPADLVPFGPYGGGQMTGHPIGLVIVIFMLLMELPLLFVSLPLGGICALVLWLRRRREGIEPGLTLLKL